MNPSQNRTNWSEPLPRRLARPTYWPAILALAITLALFGPVTSMAITGVGLTLAAVALGGWIGDMGRE